MKEVPVSLSTLLFGNGCSNQDKVWVLEILQVSNTAVEGKYLGLPTSEGRMGKDKFKTTK
jgi:hypothetical protein